MILHLSDASLRKSFIKELGYSLENIGFVKITQNKLIENFRLQLYSSVQEFFSLSDNIKKKYEKKELMGQRGYTSKNVEHAKDNKHPDLKEFFQVGMDPQGNNGSLLENVKVEEVPEMNILGSKTYKILHEIGTLILRAIALYLDLDEKFFDDKTKEGDSILRFIHYYPIKDAGRNSKSVRAAEHCDINLITLLMGASAEGLQVLRKDKEWISVNAKPNELIMNIGDMLDRLTNSKLKSTLHRVINPNNLDNTSRYSIPFFMHPISSMNLNSLPYLVSSETPKIYPDITAGEFLDERLREIGLKG